MGPLNSLFLNKYLWILNIVYILLIINIKINSITLGWLMSDREKMEYDVVIVGGGPSGLSTAIKLKQLSNEKLI